MKRIGSIKPGFTFLEMVVSIGIIVMITGIFLANYKDSNKRQDLNMSAQQLVSNIRLTQGYALGLSKYGDGSFKDIPTGGWGLHLDSSNGNNKQYIIFADEDGNGRYSSDEAVESEGGRIIKLPNNIIISSLSNGSVSDITFLPPDPITTIINSTGQSFGTFKDLGGSKRLDIVLLDSSNGNKAVVRVNFLGLAEVISQ